MLRTPCVTGLAVLLPAAAALAEGFQPSDQSRVVSGMIGVPCEQQMPFENVAAPDFARFDESVELEIDCGDNGASASASQLSTIGETLFSASGAVTAATRVEVFDFTLSFADSWYEVDFELPDPARIRIAGTLGASAAAELPPSYAASASVGLSRDFELIFGQGVMAMLNEPPVEATVDHVQRLDPGAYTFRVEGGAVITDAFPVTGTFAASYDATMAAFHLADLDLSGLVDVDDLVALVLAWGPCADCPPADLDLDGDVDVDDLVALVLAWGATGP